LLLKKQLYNLIMNRSENIAYCTDNYLHDIIDQVDNLTDEQLNNAVQATKYPQRRIDGQAYSDMMGARLINLDAEDSIKKSISEYFAVPQSFLCQGWWKSAFRDMQTKIPTEHVDQALIDEITLAMQNYITESY